MTGTGVLGEGPQLALTPCGRMILCDWECPLQVWLSYIASGNGSGPNLTPLFRYTCHSSFPPYSQGWSWATADSVSSEPILGLSRGITSDV